MRAIDADALIEKYGEWYTEEGTEEGFIGTIKNLIDEQPTIDLPHWIPVTERLPENDDKVLCCTVTTKGIRNIVIGYYMERWCCGMNSNVIAWMPLPEVYGGGA